VIEQSRTLLRRDLQDMRVVCTRIAICVRCRIEKRRRFVLAPFWGRDKSVLSRTVVCDRGVAEVLSSEKVGDVGVYRHRHVGVDARVHLVSQHHGHLRRDARIRVALDLRI
jgi:hypothetical protein